MLGSIIGDIIGSPYEFSNHRSVKFPLFTERSIFTDDTVLTVATAVKLLDGGTYAERYREFYRLYPHCSYGSRFHAWGRSESLQPYNSYGNGAAMRVSPIGWAFDTMEETLDEAALSAEATHNHPEGIKGAQATAAAVFLARTGSSKPEIREYIMNRFGYHLEEDIDYLREYYEYNETCQRTVPESIAVFLASTDFEDAIRKAVSIGGDSDTIACIVGGVAEAFHGKIPAKIRQEALGRLDERLREAVERIEEHLKRHL
jgi:ADP-ribosylglycohydrolase